MSSALYHTLMDTPDLPLLLKRVNRSLEQEKAKREAFYDWLTPSVKAEFINGEIIMHSPAKNRHLVAVGNLFSLMHTFTSLHQLGAVHSEKALIALTRNDYEPDICFWNKEKADTFDEDTMKHPAPNLIVEVLSKTTEARDRGVKFQDYAAHGVGEYWIIDPYEQTVEVYQLDEEFMQYEGGEKLTVKAMVEAKAIADFKIPIRAIFEAKAFRETLSSLVSN